MTKKVERETLAQLTATPSYISDIICLCLLPTLFHDFTSAPWCEGLNFPGQFSLLLWSPFPSRSWELMRYTFECMGSTQDLTHLNDLSVRRQFLLVPQGEAANVSQIYYPRKIHYNKLSAK